MPGPSYDYNTIVRALGEITRININEEYLGYTLYIMWSPLARAPHCSTSGSPKTNTAAPPKLEMIRDASMFLSIEQISIFSGNFWPML